MRKKKNTKPAAWKRKPRSSKDAPTKAPTNVNVELTADELDNVSGGITASRLGIRHPIGISSW